MFKLSVSIVCVINLCIGIANCYSPTDNINGGFQVRQNFHYSNKTSIEWGHNGELEFSVNVIMPQEATTYDCSNTTDYSCEDPSWIYDWNKLWGKARCGYMHDHHTDSDRFVWRRCSDSSCSAYDGTPKIQLAGYSYDGGVAPYTGQKPQLLPIFKTTILPGVEYKLTLAMNDKGLSTFTLSSADGSQLESQYVQHDTLCEKDFNEGTLQGLYFGGTCTAPVTIVVQYRS
jgi:hypothetical protein